MSRWRTGRQAVFAALFAAVIGVGSAYAFTVTPGNNPEPDEENLLLNTGQTGLVVQGTTNQSGAVVNLSGVEELTLPSNGQARVEATDGGFRVLGISTEFGIANFGDLILNIKLNGEGQASGSVFFVGTTLSGTTASGSFALGNGENFFTLLANPGDPFVSVLLVESGENDIHDVRQIRLSQVCVGEDCFPSRVAEPTMVTLLGASMLGLVGLVRRRNGR